MTLKKALLRGILGAPLGVFTGYTITILIALFNLENRDYNPVVPQLATQMNNEIIAVILQYVLMGIMGFAWAVSSAVNEVEQWGIAKQTIISFIIITISALPIAYVCYWMEHSVYGILSYVGIFVGFFFIGWLAQMYFWSRRIKRINNQLHDKNKG